MKKERLDELIQKYVLGNLTKSEATELSVHMERDDASDSRRKLRLALRADSYLQEAAAYQDNEGGEVPQKTRLTADRILWPLASALLVMAIGIFAWNHTDQPVATIQRIEGQGMKNKNIPLAIGSPLFADDILTLKNGLVEIVYKDTGVHAIATAPLSLTIHNSQLVYLNRGDLKLHVPPQGVGFVVKTAQREITDLGTTFVVSAEAGKSRVLVLDGLVSVGDRTGIGSQYYTKGDAATFTDKGDFRQLVKKVQKLPEIAWSHDNPGYLPGRIYSLKRSDYPLAKEQIDILGEKFLPWINSGFRNRDSLSDLPFVQTSSSLFGIAGAYSQFAERHLDSDTINRSGWIACYQGRILPPGPGRYRFRGYGDNQLLVAIDGKTVFEGGRFDSAFRMAGTFPRQNHPAWPCLNSQAGFASGSWFEVGEEPVQLDLLFGEKRGILTYGLLLIEREGETYEETYYGQPRWPVFLTTTPNSENRNQLDRLNTYLEEKLLGAFSIDDQAVWNAVE